MSNIFCPCFSFPTRSLRERSHMTPVIAGKGGSPKNMLMQTLGSIEGIMPSISLVKKS